MFVVISLWVFHRPLWEEKYKINVIFMPRVSLLTSVYLLTPILHNHLQLLYVFNGFIHARQGTVEQGTSATPTRADGLKIGLISEENKMRSFQFLLHVQIAFAIARASIKTLENGK